MERGKILRELADLQPALIDELQSALGIESKHELEDLLRELEEDGLITVVRLPGDFLGTIDRYFALSWSGRKLIKKED